jgi:CheY-like chemotaxis protein
MPGLSQIQRSANRAASLTQQLLAFSRKQVLQPRVLDLNEIVADVQKMLARVISEDIELVTRLHPSLTPVKADPTQMEQVVMNLAVNARDAMPHGGTLLVETCNFDCNAAYARQHAGLREGRYVKLTVTDTGHGMDADTLKHIFEPFFTTKLAGKGTGMGLATVYGIVSQSGGCIQTSSEVGKGTTFEVYLPSEAGALEPVIEERVEQVTGGSETILLVEDERTLRELTRIFLHDFGYGVLEAGTVQEALNIANTFPHSIDLLLTDVIMPGMNGRELAERILLLRPATKIVYMTGCTDDVVVRHKVLEPGISLLQKPFTKAELGKKFGLPWTYTDRAYVLVLAAPCSGSSVAWLSV